MLSVGMLTFGQLQMSAVPLKDAHITVLDSE